ncbi:hypothetical protein BV22DRAFT_900320 [Leucogyrophana mollusca]|uniref:Uncharacterized protein n=1 Tax=Leucogyrophana mollusca TaxID=85980 RepID=A0ACB8AYQ7_9AGAM|nr:hypothetical protein BV22DRAFT_900320 [Leucogyrophana mollusca]
MHHHHRPTPPPRLLRKPLPDNRHAPRARIRRYPLLVAPPAHVRRTPIPCLVLLVLWMGLQAQTARMSTHQKWKWWHERVDDHAGPKARGGVCAE